jgi:hypothetical protein
LRHWLAHPVRASPRHRSGADAANTTVGKVISQPAEQTRDVQFASNGKEKCRGVFAESVASPMNLIGVNLAGMTTCFVQRIVWRPDRRKNVR